jgi:hypothetical protein
VVSHTPSPPYTRDLPFNSRRMCFPIFAYYSSLTQTSYIQMSGMILGGMLEADKRMVAYQHRVRHHKRVARDMEIWRRYEDSYEERGTPGVGGESEVHGTQDKNN